MRGLSRRFWQRGNHGLLNFRKGELSGRFACYCFGGQSNRAERAKQRQQSQTEIASRFIRISWSTCSSLNSKHLCLRSVPYAASLSVRSSSWQVDAPTAGIGRTRLVGCQRVRPDPLASVANAAIEMRFTADVPDRGSSVTELASLGR